MSRFKEPSDVSLPDKQLLLPQVRRFQIKFSQDRDYYTALAILSEINCPLTEGNTPPVHPLQRLSSSSSWASGPSAQLSTTAATNVNPAMTPASNATVPFYPMAGHMSDMMTSMLFVSVESQQANTYIDSVSSSLVIVKHHPPSCLGRWSRTIKPPECRSTPADNRRSIITHGKHDIPKNRDPARDCCGLP